MPTLKSGEATAERVSLELVSQRDNHWARKQATEGGDATAFAPDGCSILNIQPFEGEISTSSCRYCSATGSQDDCYADDGVYEGALTEKSPFLDFKVKMGDIVGRDFNTSYVNYKTFLDIHLSVNIPSHIMRCLMKDEHTVPQDFDQEDAMWDVDSPIGHPDEDLHHGPAYHLRARVPITVVGPQYAPASPSPNHPVHYLEPNVASPVLFKSPPSSIEDVAFPPSTPVTKLEAVEITRKRILEDYEDGGDHTERYGAGSYAGALWQKKLLMARGTRASVDAGEPRRDSDDRIETPPESQIVL